MRRFSASLLVLVLALVGLGSTAVGQVPTPRLRSVFPPGCRAGETVEVLLTGDDLEGVNSLWFDHPGLRAFHVKGATYRIAVGTDVPPGHHDVAAYGPEGVSNPWTFVVSARPERPETEPNDDPAQANPIALGETLDGRTERAADVDCFAFDGTQGQRVVLDLDSRSLGSRLDGSLRLFGPDGGEIFEAMETGALDPALDVTLPAAGRYVVRVQDVTYAGSPEHIYRLTLHDSPRVVAIEPTAVPAGATAEVTLLGRGLGGAAVEGLSVDGGPVEGRRVEVQVPTVEGQIGSLPGTGHVPAPLFAGPGWRVPVEDSARPGEPLSLLPTSDPVVAEVEPNDGEPAQVVTPPCVVSGRWGTPGDRDVFRFTARKGDVWWMEVAADRLGSPADPALVVQRVAGGEIKDLAASDDIPGPEHSPDPALRFAVPEDGEYQIVLTDVFGSSRGDVRSRYALEIRRERPDFRLFVTAGGAAAPPVGVTLRPGGRTEALATITRLEGFDSTVRVELEGLPPGVTAEPVLIAPGQTSAPLVLTAAPEAAPTILPVRVVGRSVSPDRKELLTFTPGSSRVAAERVRLATPYSAIWPPVSSPGDGATVVVTRATNGLLLAVADSDPPFRLSAGPGDLVVTAGEAVDVGVEVTRYEGFAEAVQVATAILPPKVGAANATIAKEATTGSLKLTIPKDVPPGVYTVLLRGTAPFSTGMGKKGGRKRNTNAVEPSNTITLRVLKPAT